MALWVVAAAGLAPATGPAAPPAPTVPLCPGLTIVTAVSQPNGDYESIKTIESVGPADVRLKYLVGIEGRRSVLDDHGTPQGCHPSHDARG